MRPPTATAFRSSEKMKTTNRLEIEKSKTTVLPLTQIRPQEWGYYQETTNLASFADEVICSGHFQLIGGATLGAGHMLGLINNDSLAGDLVEIEVEGECWVPIDFDGVSAATPRVNASTTGLLNKQCYYLVNEGLFTDQEPADGVANPYIKCGKFVEEDTAVVKPADIQWGGYFAYIRFKEDPTQAEVAAPPVVVATPATGNIFAFPSVITSSNGLEVDFYANAFSTNPGIVLPRTAYVWTIDGNVQTAGDQVTYVFGAPGAGIAVQLDINYGSLSYSQAGTVDIVADTPAVLNGF